MAQTVNIPASIVKVASRFASLSGTTAVEVAARWMVNGMRLATVNESLIAALEAVRSGDKTVDELSDADRAIWLEMIHAQMREPVEDGDQSWAHLATATPSPAELAYEALPAELR